MSARFPKLDVAGPSPVARSSGGYCVGTSWEWLLANGEEGIEFVDHNRGPFTEVPLE